jgi:hypothetical protein
MRIAFIHYHLKTGGVTSVLKQQLESIRNDCETLVLTGEPPQATFPSNVVHIPQLAYNNRIDSPFDPRDVATSITRAIGAHFKNSCDVLHVHNPTLAKNSEFLNILKCLQDKGIRLFLQIHDLAEDGRPAIYFSEDYPSNCHYGVINSRDYHLLLKAGLKPEGLHLIANAVSAPPAAAPASAGKPFVLYPIRAIRRKNIGEAILLSLFFKHSETLAISLPPNSPADFESYNGWKQFVKSFDLRVEFDQGLKHDFSMLVQSAQYLITTSISEGFGFSFLEPWLYDQYLCGRKLADICQDFEKNGLDLEHLYPGLMVPVEWAGYRQFREHWKTCVSDTCQRFNFEIENNRISAAFDTMTRSGHVDFSILNEPYQKKIIALLTEKPSFLKVLEKRNPCLRTIGSGKNKVETINRNKKAVRSHYDMNRYRRKLLETYKTVSRQTVNQHIDKKLLLTNFLDLSQFSLLKWCDYREKISD